MGWRPPAQGLRPGPTAPLEGLACAPTQTLEDRAVTPDLGKRSLPDRAGVVRWTEEGARVDHAGAGDAGHQVGGAAARAGVDAGLGRRAREGAEGLDHLQLAELLHALNRAIVEAVEGVTLLL